MKFRTILKVLTFLSLTALLVMKSVSPFEYLILGYLFLVFKNKSFEITINNNANN